MLTQKKIQHAGARKGMKGMCRACYRRGDPQELTMDRTLDELKPIFDKCSKKKKIKRRCNKKCSKKKHTGKKLKKCETKCAQKKCRRNYCKKYDTSDMLSHAERVQARKWGKARGSKSVGPCSKKWAPNVSRKDAPLQVASRAYTNEHFGRSQLVDWYEKSIGSDNVRDWCNKKPNIQDGEMDVGREYIHSLPPTLDYDLYLGGKKGDKKLKAGKCMATTEGIKNTFDVQGLGNRCGQHGKELCEDLEDEDTQISFLERGLRKAKKQAQENKEDFSESWGEVVDWVERQPGGSWELEGNHPATVRNNSNNNLEDNSAENDNNNCENCN